jgi:adenylate cyclase class IV
VVADPAGLRSGLIDAGAVPGFRGLLVDTRFDREGDLFGRDEVLRVREFRPREGASEFILGWKGPATVSSGGYKQRTELEYAIVPRIAGPEALLSALGYRAILLIERYVEYYRLAGADVRLEWYPRMDILVEVEGGAPEIEAALALMAIPREEFTSESLTAFAARYGARTGRPALLSLAELAGEPPGWGNLP